MSHELVIVQTSDDWEAYHRIRRTVLFEARGRFGLYDTKHADEFRPNHFPLLLKWNARGVATTRLDVREHGLAITRLVAVEGTEQRKGHGRALITLAETFARDKGVTKLTVNSAPDAVEFYQRVGFVRETWDESERIGWNADAVQMTKVLA
jgi:GNAT superfamily N-acetyltransferase